MKADLYLSITGKWFWQAHAGKWFAGSLAYTRRSDAKRGLARFLARVRAK